MRHALKEDWEPSNDNFRGLTMRQIENFPIYFKTEDRRINAFLQKNKLHHELNLRVARKGGRIRMAVFAVALYLIGALSAWGLV